MMLNLLRSDDLSVEDMMKRSFAEFHLLKQAPERERMKSKFTEDLKQLEQLDCERCLVDVEPYYNDCKELTTLTKSLQVRCLLRKLVVLLSFASLVEQAVLCLREQCFRTALKLVLRLLLPCSITYTGHILNTFNCAVHSLCRCYFL